MAKEYENIWYCEESGKIGLLNEKAEEIGSVASISLPKKGNEIKKGDTLFTIEGAKVSIEVNAPFDLKIVNVNDEVSKEPDKITENPKDNWILKIEAV